LWPPYFIKTGLTSFKGDPLHSPSSFNLIKLENINYFKQIKSIEGNFNEKGILDGEAEILYHDTNLAKGYFRKGVINGMVSDIVFCLNL
jgi:hypothetical protein